LHDRSQSYDTFTAGAKQLTNNYPATHFVIYYNYYQHTIR
jgi:hypothetical protein